MNARDRVLAAADRDSEHVPPLTQSQADRVAAILAAAQPAAAA